MQPSKLKPLFHLAKLNHARTAVTDAISAAAPSELKSWREIPGPPSLPIIGQVYHFFPGGELHGLNGFQFGRHLQSKYGPIVRFNKFVGKPPNLFLFDANCVEKVHCSENWYPLRPGFESLNYYRQKYRQHIKDIPKLEVKGSLTDNGEPWKQFRSTVNPVMMQPKTIKLYADMRDEVSQDMITRMKSLRGPDNKIHGNFDMEMNLWALESIALFALGRRLKCFDSQLPDNSPEKRLIYVVHEIFKVANDLDFQPSIWKVYPTKIFKKAMKLYEEHELLARYFIDKTIEEMESRKETVHGGEKSILEKLLDINKDAAIIMASDALFAGVDTTSNTIMAVLYLLANNQEKQHKLREEIRSTPNPHEKRPYLKACLKESMRIMPVAGGNARLTTKEYEMLGYRIPAGIQITFMHHNMSMMEEQYPQAKEFQPERWLTTKDDPQYHGTAHSFAFLPFGFGARTCIGRRIAALEMETFLARLIENFKVEWDGPPVTVKSAAINYVKGPYNYVFKDI